MSRVYVTGELIASTLNLDLEMLLQIRGVIASPARKYRSVITTCAAIFLSGKLEEAARAVATANTAHRPISSSTATPSTSRANLVCNTFRSKNILEITGMDVTATAMLMTKMREPRSPLLPINQAKGRMEATASITKKGRQVPAVASQAICLRSCF